MALAVSAGLSRPYTAAAGRKFGVTVGGAFLALSALARWRDRSVTVTVLGSLAVLLLASALFIPRRLGPLERAWMGVAGLISKVTTPIFMGIVYFGILTPIGLVRRGFGVNSLVHRLGRLGFWADRGASPRGPLDRQF